MPVTRFETTRWSLVLEASSAEQEHALEHLCRAYRPPVLAYVRRLGITASEAEDLTQEFFARIVLENQLHRRADPRRGRFRSFLVAALKNFLVSDGMRRSARKRGGGIPHCDIDGSSAMADDVLHGDDGPERAFERSWALTVLARAREQLATEAAEAGNVRLFERLKPFLSEQPDAAEYATIADELDMRPNTVAVAVHRLRQRLRELVLEELSQTVAGARDLRDEMGFMRRSLGPRADASTDPRP